MIELANVHVSIPVFANDYSRAIRTIVGKKILGGRLTTTSSGKVTVNALRGVSFKVSAGERVGIIGGNGAGKTTLLKVIAGIVPVSEGTVDVQGEVRSFFNIGAGLDMTRSGFRNIESMSQYYTRDLQRIRDATPKIVEFAEIGEFIHMPVYTYSAGMQARLMVAIATAYGGDNIVFDEMLGAGDSKFITKVEKKLEEMMGAARCVVIASHSTTLLNQLCERAIWMDKGCVKAHGSVAEVEKLYREAAA
jgi:ABC-type polysaccharide/polyol phosphate transport system ATPase subunit